MGKSGWITIGLLAAGGVGFFLWRTDQQNKAKAQRDSLVYQVLQAERTGQQLTSAQLFALIQAFGPDWRSAVKAATGTGTLKLNAA